MFKSATTALSAFVLLTSFAAAADQTMVTVTRGTVSATAVEWPDLVARTQGFYVKEGLKVEQAMISPTTITPSLIGGTIQIGFINASQLIIADKAGADLVAVGKGADPSAYSLVTARDIKTVADLKGRTLSLAEPGDAYAEATRIILRKAGLDPEKDVNVRYGGNSNQRMAALAAGAVDAVPLVPPQDQIMIGQGFNSVAYYPDFFPRLALSTTAVSRAWAMKNQETVKAFLRAQAAATRWLYDPANKDAAIKVLMDETKAPRDAASQSYDIYVINLKMYAMNACVDPKGFETLIDLLSKVNKAVKEGEPVSQFIDTEWCPN